MTKEQLAEIRALATAQPDSPGPKSAFYLCHYHPHEVVYALLDEVERLQSDPLPAAAWVREVERAAFKRGAEAMRESAAQRCEVSPIHGERTTTARRYADTIRALPIPEDTHNRKETK
jgi:hypothetical protein